MYRHICIYVNIFVNMFTCVHINTCACMYIDIPNYLCIHMSKYLCIHIVRHLQRLFKTKCQEGTKMQVYIYIHTYMHVRININGWIYVESFVYICMHIYIHIYIFIYIYIYIYMHGYISDGNVSFGKVLRPTVRRDQSPTRAMREPPKVIAERKRRLSEVAMVLGQSPTRKIWNHNRFEFFLTLSFSFKC
jgi:hypothetical protein